MTKLENSCLLGDCLELMKEIPGKSINLILTDLPYGITQCSWDFDLPLKILWEQWYRILKEDGVILLTSIQPYTTTLIASNLKGFREEIIWLKNRAGNGLLSNQRHIKVHESVLIFSKKTNYTFNPQKWLVDKKEFLTQRKTFKEKEFGNNIYDKIIKMRPDDTSNLRNPISVISCRVPFTTSKSKTYSNKIDIRLHPTQKPLELFEYLINTYSNTNDTILDCCAGSGTTAIACININRKYICIEKDVESFKIMEGRIRNQIKPLEVFNN